MMNLPRYTRQDTTILLSVLIPGVVALNLLLFGTLYVSDIWLFLSASVITFVVMAVSWIAHTWVAVTLRSRFSREGEAKKRITLAIFLFLLMTGCTLSVLFWGYDAVHFFGYELNQSRYEVALLAGGIANIFITFLHEGVSSFEKWKTTLKETEQLKREYMQSQLLGLKSQVNPHFLFNSLNSLSSLIIEDRVEAEKFLDEMSKVYRYLLKSTDEQLVSLESELQFITSYFYMLKIRYRGAVELDVKVGPDLKSKYLPPLTLQILMESAFNLNTVSKEQPLTITISAADNGWLQVKNNIQRKIGDMVDNTGIDNITNKFRLLCQQSIVVNDTGSTRIIELPLMNFAESIIA